MVKINQYLKHINSLKPDKKKILEWSSLAFMKALPYIYNRHAYEMPNSKYTYSVYQPKIGLNSITGKCICENSQAPSNQVYLELLNEGAFNQQTLGQLTSQTLCGNLMNNEYWNLHVFPNCDGWNFPQPNPSVVCLTRRGEGPREQLQVASYGLWI